MVNGECHFKMLPKYFLYFNYSKFPRKADELEINQKNSRDAWEKKTRKGNTGAWRTQGMSHEARETREYVGHETREALEHATLKARKD